MNNDKCHSLNRTGCLTNTEVFKKHAAQFDKLHRMHLFHNSVSCAKNVFGYDDTEINTNELIPGENHLSSETDDLQYFHLNADISNPSAYEFKLEFPEQYSIAWDFLDCHGREKFVEKPDFDENYCGVYQNIKDVEFIAYEPKSPVYLTLKFKGKAVIKIIPIISIELKENSGTISNENIKYQNFNYNAAEPGYILLQATSQVKAGVNLFHHTEGCKPTLSTYPRLEKHCLRQFDLTHTQLVIPSHNPNQHHYFGITLDRINTVQFTYEFIGITEIGEEKKEFTFDNAYAKPFKYNAKKGSNKISVNVTNDMDNTCDIYVDYPGCRIGSTTLPDVHNNCLAAKPSKKCTLKFDLEEDTVVYFGVQTVINEKMTVIVSRDSKQLTFLD
jgi:hypothetical protein